MPDKRTHRGPAPEDAVLFAKRRIAPLQQAVHDLNWLLSRGYADKSSLKLVGDRYRLTKRQQIAVMRCACSDAQRDQRAETELSPDDICGQSVVVDGYNILITVEAALSGAILIKGADGCIRDLASIHGTYRKVQETLPALSYIAAALNRLEIAETLWLLDSPVSNSGRLKQLMLDFAVQNALNWNVELVLNPDNLLATSEKVAITSDSAILNRCQRWFNFIPRVLPELPIPPKTLWLIDLSGHL